MSEKDPEGFGLGEKSEENRKIESDAAKLRARKIGDRRKVLSFKEGRRTLMDILEKCGVFQASFNQNSNLTAFHEGQRDIGLMILSEIMEADATAFHQMYRERYSENKSKQDQKEEQ